MAEWSIAHAWKSDRFTRTDASQDPPTHVRSISSRYNEVLRDAPVSDSVHPGFRGVCDTVLTQNAVTVSEMPRVVNRYALLCDSRKHRNVGFATNLTQALHPLLVVPAWPNGRYH